MLESESQVEEASSQVEEESMRELTDQQQRFVIEFTSGNGAIGNASEAARRAGYSEKTAAEQGRQLLNKPHVVAAIEEANRGLINGSLTTLALDVIQKILEDEDANPRLRLDAAKTALDRAGYIAPKAPEAPERLEKPLSELSVQELEDFIRQRRAWTEEKARLANVKPH